MQGMVKIIIPVGIQTITSKVRGTHQAHIVEVALRHQIEFLLPALPSLEHGRGQLGHERLRRQIHNGMKGVQTQGVNVIFRVPKEGVVDKKAPHLIAVRAVEIEGRPPGGAVAPGEIRAVVGQVVPLRPQVVVDHVQDHGQAPLMAGVDQSFQAFGSAIGVLHREGINPVVAPVAPARKLGHRHQLQGGDPQIFQIIQMGDNGVEGPFRGKSPHVQFINHVIGKGEAGPMAVVPGEIRLNHLGRAVHPLGLKPGGRVREILLPVKPVKIAATRLHPGDHGGKITPFPSLQGHQLFPGGNQTHLHLRRQRRPHQEPAASLSQVCSSQADGCLHNFTFLPETSL